MLKKIIYQSFASAPIGEVEIAHILESSRKNNSALQITGCLLYHDREFLQLLEGEEKVVDALMAKIETDPRHSDISIIDSQTTNERLYHDWSMAYEPLDLPLMKQLEGHLNIGNFVHLSQIQADPGLGDQLFRYISSVILQ